MKYVVLPTLALALAASSLSLAHADGVEVDSSPAAASIESVLEEHSVDLAARGLTIRGSVKKRGKRFRLDLEVVGPDGVVASHRFAGKTKRALAKNVEAKLWSVFAEALAEPAEASEPEVTPLPAVASEPDEPEPAPENSSDESKEPASLAKKPTSAPDEPATTPVSVLADDALPSVYLQIGGGAFNRNLSYRDDLFGRLTGYDLGAAPVMQVRATWFPGAHLGKRGALANIGLEAQYEAPFGLDTEGLDGESYATQAFAWGTAALYRAGLGDWAFTGGLNFAMRSFQIAEGAMGEARPDIPNTNYSQLGLQAGVLTPSFGGISFEARGGVHTVLSSGDIGSRAWFPQSSANGAFAELVIAYALGEQIGVFAGASWLQQGFDLAPQPGDSNVAGGALDRYVSATMGLRYAGK